MSANNEHQMNFFFFFNQMNFRRKTFPFGFQIGSLSPLTFKVIIDVYCTYYQFVIYFLVVFVVTLFFSSFNFFPDDWMIFFNGIVVFHCVYVRQLSYLFLWWWTSRLRQCPSYCKQCCNKHWDTRVFFNTGFLGVYAQQWDCWVIWWFYFQFFK